MKSRAVAMTMAFLAALSVAAAGAEWHQTAKLTIPDGASYGFGFSVAVDGDTVLVAADRRDMGAVYVYQGSSSGWVSAGELVPDVSVPESGFGRAIALSGTTAIVGANDAAYIFEKGPSGWMQTGRFLNPGPQFEYGVSVDVDAEVALVGALDYDFPAVYVYEKGPAGWSETGMLESGKTYAFDYFGCSVAISGDVIVVGADGSVPATVSQGRAYVFEKNADEWTLISEVVASDGWYDDMFGTNVDVSGPTAVIGAGDLSSEASLSAYVLERESEGWEEVSKLGLPEGDIAPFYGDVAISSGRILVGVDGAGPAYLFECTETEWLLSAELSPIGGLVKDEYFGMSVSIDGQAAVVGAHGTAYIFEANIPVPGDANGDGKVDGLDLAYWQVNYDPLGVAENTWEMGDFNDDGRIDGGDLAVWQQNYDPIGPGGMDGTASIPEPLTLWLLGTGALVLIGAARRRQTV